MLAERRVLLDNAETVAALAKEMSEFLQMNEITETRAFVRSFVKETEIGDANSRVNAQMNQHRAFSDREALSFESHSLRHFLF